MLRAWPLWDDRSFVRIWDAGGRSDALMCVSVSNDVRIRGMVGYVGGVGRTARMMALVCMASRIPSVGAVLRACEGCRAFSVSSDMCECLGHVGGAAEFQFGQKTLLSALVSQEVPFGPDKFLLETSTTLPHVTPIAIAPSRYSIHYTS